jgi:hypothetical protein
MHGKFRTVPVCGQLITLFRHSRERSTCSSKLRMPTPLDSRLRGNDVREELLNSKLPHIGRSYRRLTERIAQGIDKLRVSLTSAFSDRKSDCHLSY